MPIGYNFAIVIKCISSMSVQSNIMACQPGIYKVNHIDATVQEELLIIAF